MIRKYDVIIIGAGPAGLFSAIAIKNKDVLILEKNLTSGKKLLISGAGQCNYTNFCEIEEFLKKYGNKGRFLKPALYNFTNKDALNFFRAEGVNSIVREDKKVFPSSLKSVDILNALINKCVNKGVEIIYNSLVESVQYDNVDNFFYIKTSNVLFACSKLVIATGGKSYTDTGSSGDGYLFAKSLGHTVEKTIPALTPVYVEDYKFRELSGISFENISISLWRNNKKINQFSGDMLFTHQNLSGPIIINNSRFIEKGDILRINFTKYMSQDEFKKFFEHKIALSGKLNVKTVIKELNMPKRFIDKIMELAKVDGNKICGELDKISRKRIVELLSNYPIVVQSLGDYNIAMITKGGVSTNEINSKTMESKIVKNLYFSGEVLDIDGDTGGYNIQAALSMGKLVGDSINDDVYNFE